MTQISSGVTFTTARYDVRRLGFVLSSLALTRTIKATGESLPLLLVTRHSALVPTLENAYVTTCQKSNG